MWTKPFKPVTCELPQATWARSSHVSSWRIALVETLCSLLHVWRKPFPRQLLTSNGLSIKGGNALGMQCSNEFLILNTKSFLDISWCIFEMENESDETQCCSCISFLVFQNGTRWFIYLFFFNPLGLNKGKGAEILRTRIWTRNMGFGLVLLGQLVAFTAALSTLTAAS